MNFGELRCPRCNKTLNNTAQKDVFFCKRCDCYIMMEDLIESVESKQQNAAWEQHERSKQFDFTRKLILIACVVILALGSYAVSFFHSNISERKLQHTVDVVLQDMKKGDYSAARSNANSLYYTGDSTKLKEKWDATRIQLLKDIDKAERKRNGYGPFGWFADKPEESEPEQSSEPGTLIHGFKNDP